MEFCRWVLALRPRDLQSHGATQRAPLPVWRAHLSPRISPPRGASDALGLLPPVAMTTVKLNQRDVEKTLEKQDGAWVNMNDGESESQISFFVSFIVLFNEVFAGVVLSESIAESRHVYPPMGSAVRRSAFVVSVICCWEAGARESVWVSEERAQPQLWSAVWAIWLFKGPGG